jgi:hypothetical protein
MPSVTLLANVRAGINGLMAEVLEDHSGLAAASFSIMFVADAGATSSRSASLRG